MTDSIRFTFEPKTGAEMYIGSGDDYIEYYGGRFENGGPTSAIGGSTLVVHGVLIEFKKGDGATITVTCTPGQTITFGKPDAQDFGTNPTLTATASSGLPVTFTSATTGVCTITSDGVLTFVKTGTCTIRANQAGNSSYNAAPQVTQSFTVSATSPGAPTIGTASAGDAQAIVSFTAPASTGGAAITGYTVTASPYGVTATGLGSPVIVTGLTNGTDYTFTVTATNSAGTGNASAATNSVRPMPALPAPIANNVSATVSGNSIGNAIALSTSGGAPASVTVVTQAGHGIATAAATSIIYTPTAGYSGSDSFTYAATNATGTSAAATVTITVTAPTFTFSPAAGALPTGTVNTPYSGSVAASGGTSPYGYVVSAGALPSSLTLDGSTGTISGTPTTPGNYGFTLTATDANNATGSASYTVTVEPPLTAFTFTPAAGPLTDAMQGEDYHRAISATGGSAPLLYSLVAGTLPDGMVLNVSTGALTGPVSADAAVKDYSVTIQVQDRHGATGTANYTIKVTERTVTVTDKQVETPAGSTPTNLDLTKGATGGPFVAADIVSVEPHNAGTVSIVNGEFAQAGSVGPIGWYLKFIPNPTYSGQARVYFRLTSALGNSNVGMVSYTLGHDAGEVAAEIDTLVHGFVQSRQNLITSTIKVPGLIERRQMANTADPLTARLTPSANGITTSFSTSLVQMDVAANSADGLGEAGLSPFNIWIDGTFMLHNRDQNGGNWGSFGMVSAGADYLLSEQALIGLAFHYDRMTDPTNADATLTGNGWLAGPYASFEIGKGVFWDTGLFYGGSSNRIDTAFWDGSFDTQRWLFDSAITGQWQLDAMTTLAPKLRTVYFAETVQDYAATNGNGDVLDIRGSTTEQLRVSLGAEIARQFTLENGSTLTPRLGLTAGFAGLKGSRAFGQVSAGLSLDTPDAWTLDFGLLVNSDGSDQTSAGARIGIGGRF